MNLILKILHEKFKKLYIDNEELKTDVFESANIFLERNKERINIDYELARKLANEVIVEELALFTYMGELGYEGHIYPSTFMKVLTDISALKYEFIPAELSTQSEATSRVAGPKGSKIADCCQQGCQGIFGQS